jgi:hypothetical protein
MTVFNRIRKHPVTVQPGPQQSVGSGSELAGTPRVFSLSVSNCHFSGPSSASSSSLVMSRHCCGPQLGPQQGAPGCPLIESNMTVSGSEPGGDPGAGMLRKLPVLEQM